jgi:hypothetical protein
MYSQFIIPRFRIRYEGRVMKWRSQRNASVWHCTRKAVGFMRWLERCCHITLVGCGSGCGNWVRRTRAIEGLMGS